MNLRVPSMKPSRTDLSVTSALKSAQTRMDLRVSSISIFQGPLHSSCFYGDSCGCQPDKYCHGELELLYTILLCRFSHAHSGPVPNEYCLPV